MPPHTATFTRRIDLTYLDFMKDALGRRSRFAPPAALKSQFQLSPRDWRIFETLDRHGKLPTNYIYEFTKDIGVNYSFLQRRLTQLYNGYCNHVEHRMHGFENLAHTCAAQSFLVRDFQQFNNLQARYQPIIYSLSPLGHRLLMAEGRAAKYAAARNDSFVHQFFGGCFGASVELLAAPHRFISLEDILQRDTCPAATRNAANPLAIPINDPDAKHLVPDNLFGLAFEGGGYRFFAVEIDRNTETISPKKPVRNSIAKKLKGYTDIIANRTFASHFGIPNLTILFATTNFPHLDRMVSHVRENVDARYHRKFLFNAFPDFGDVWRTPRQTLHVFDAWKTASGDTHLDANPKPPASSAA